MLKECTVRGLHDHLARTVLPAFAGQGRKAIDLGAGSGVLALRLQGSGFQVIAVDINRDSFKADVPFIQMDLNQPEYSSSLAEGSFDLVCSIEVIEHLESPISFLRNVRRLLTPGGIALITTPNMDNVPSRLRFLLTGKLHMMDERVPDHISPIFYDLFVRKYLPRARLSMAWHSQYPRDHYIRSRSCYAWAFRILARILPGHAAGDVHIFVLQKANEEERLGA